jgi:uncharacterized protein YndB with AHSA1/START domain
MTSEPAPIARVSLRIESPRSRVWRALVDPTDITRYMPATDVQSDWREGSTITWRSEIGVRPRDVQGVILRLEPERVFEYRYVNPYSRATHRVTIELSDDGEGTRIALAEDGQKNERELAHGEGGWRLALNNLRALLERS